MDDLPSRPPTNQVEEARLHELGFLGGSGDPFPLALLDHQIALVPVVSSVVRVLDVAVLLLLAHLGAPTWGLLIALLGGILADVLLGGGVYPRLLAEAPRARLPAPRSGRRSSATVARTICSLLSDGWWCVLILGSMTAWWTWDLRWGWLSAPFALAGVVCAWWHWATGPARVVPLI